ncbi:ATP-binding protein [Paracidovorax wautersii]|uniref:histidine kinase n=1 Tax=Paracidovorax wautersii TaxID=1177982 RepID=A0ABU1IA93_9BURK|nr:ATP-binding protein [Paracidovorax wautersii]MDR6213906.1 signal transduction histidine kinase [Paracidovorax wautersii]
MPPAPGAVATSHTSAPAGRGLGLAWQYGLLLVVALIASHGIAMALLQRTGALIHPISREQALATLATAHALAGDGGADADRRTGLLARQASQAAHLWLAATPAVAPFAMQPEERRLAADLRTRLALPDGAGVWMQLERASGEDARAGLLSLAAWEPLHLRASVALSGASGAAGTGRWVNADLRLQGRYDWSPTLRYMLPASILPVLVAALWLAWRLVRPLRDLIAAAARVDYGRPQPALPLRGPREARELTRQFNAMQQRIARHRDARTRLLAAVSHDLRTPVTELRLQAQLVDDPALRTGLLESVAELEALVATTLDFTRADAQAEPAAATDIAALLHTLAQRYQQRGQAVSVGACPSPLVWRCRPLALRRAMANLVENALRHAGTAVVLEAQAYGDAGTGAAPHALEIRVLDTGPGIEPAQLEQVLEPFHQLDGARGPGRGGVGLGLSIALECAQTQGGTLALHNRAGGGLCATVRLPAVLPAPPQAST